MCFQEYNSTDMKMPAHVPRLRQLNNFLSLVVVVLAAYIVLLPFFPQFNFWVRSVSPSKPALVEAQLAANSSNNVPAPTENTLVIPRLLMQETVYDGSSASVLSRGIWRRPQTSDPNKGSNTVLVGHRFTYTDPAVFYHLDKVQSGDEIVLYWKQTKYVYEVTRVFVVPATAVEIEAPTNEPLLTLYTCTPIWSAKDRLVVQAKLKENI